MHSTVVEFSPDVGWKDGDERQRGENDSNFSAVRKVGNLRGMNVFLYNIEEKGGELASQTLACVAQKIS